MFNNRESVVVISSDVSIEGIDCIFRSLGEIQLIYRETDIDNNLDLTWIRFSTHSLAMKAIEIDGEIVAGNPIKVEPADYFIKDFKAETKRMKKKTYQYSYSYSSSSSEYSSDEDADASNSDYDSMENTRSKQSFSGKSKKDSTRRSKKSSKKQKYHNSYSSYSSDSSYSSYSYSSSSDDSDSERRPHHHKRSRH